jgi:hypothetical protein
MGAARSLITIRVLQRVVAWNTIDDHPLYAGEEFLARELTVFEYRAWEPHFGRVLPRGSSALAVFAEGDRILSGQAVIVGVEGIHWAVTGVASVA